MVGPKMTYIMMGLINILCSNFSFWVAEVLHQGDGGKCSFVEDDNAVQGSGRIVGTLALGVKKDPDMKEPPNSVAWIRRMAVAKPFQR